MKLNEEIRSDFDALIDKDKRYLLAFSGGPDSVYLLWMLSLYFGSELSEHILLCYINYHDSDFVDEEERLVDGYIHGFHLMAIKDDVYYEKEKDRNFEEWARDYRYDLFLRLVRENNLEGVLTAHQKTDVIETYLLQKKRGNMPLYYGLRKENTLYGLKVIRPLLTISKKQLTDELDKENIPYYFDITNTYDKKERNRIRMNLDENEIPVLSKKIEEENKRLFDLYKSFKSHVNGMAFTEYDSMDEEERKRYCFFLVDHHISHDGREGYGKLLFDFLKRKDKGVLSLGGKYCYRTSRFFFISEDINKVSYSFVYEKKGVYENEYFSIDLNDISKFNLKKLPVTIRNYHEGDRISTNLPTKDVRDALRKQGVPFYMIPIYPVFVQDGKIVCVPFYRDIREKKIPFCLLKSFFC